MSSRKVRSAELEWWHEEKGRRSRASSTEERFRVLLLMWLMRLSMQAEGIHIRRLLKQLRQTKLEVESNAARCRKCTFATFRLLAPVEAVRIII